MDINKSPLTGYQSHKSKTSRQAAEVKASSESSKIRELSATSATQNLKLSDLKEGQLVKGQVVDHRFHEVKLELEPGKQLVNARLASDITLSIGQEATFQVTEDPSKQLVLKYIPNQTIAPIDATAQKALLASNLPMTDRNKALATELLNHRMPLDKQTLQNLVRLSLQNKDASPLTLVLMLKNNIPMTASNIKQFEAYQNGTHQLLKDMKAISQNIAEVLLKADVIPNETSLTETVLSNLQKEQEVLWNDQNNATLNSASPAALTDHQLAIQKNTKLIDILYPNIKASLEVTTIPLKSILNQQELSSRDSLIQQKTTSNPSTSSNITANPTASQSFGLATDYTIALTNDSATGLTNDFVTGLTTDIIAGLPSNLSSEITPDLVKQDSTLILANFLGLPERTSLLQHLSRLPNTDNIKDRIEQGNATLKETLGFIQDQIAHADMDTVSKLLSSPDYARLLEEAFQQKWTITPEMVAKKNAVNDLYERLQKDLEQINSLNSAKDSMEHLHLQEPVKNLQDNLQFMKYLNEAFTYLQLPVQLKNQKAHTDLYVLTRKKALTDKKEAVSVLLHLDMTNLGSLNVHIQLANNQIQANFYMEDKQAGLLLKENLSSFTEALESKGFQIHAEIKDEYKKPDFCKDFIEQNTQDHNIQQFTFDIRT